MFIPKHFVVLCAEKIVEMGFVNTAKDFFVSCMPEKDFESSVDVYRFLASGNNYCAVLERLNNSFVYEGTLYRMLAAAVESNAQETYDMLMSIAIQKNLGTEFQIVDKICLKNFEYQNRKSNSRDKVHRNFWENFWKNVDVDRSVNRKCRCGQICK